MSKVKSDLLKEIADKVARKKQVAKEVSREKTIAHWVSEFFTEYEKMKKINAISYNTFTSLAISKLTLQLRNLDRKCDVIFKEPLDGAPTVEIHWSSYYLAINNCEDVMVFDAASAYFQSAIETI